MNTVDHQWTDESDKFRFEHARSRYVSNIQRKCSLFILMLKYCQHGGSLLELARVIYRETNSIKDAASIFNAESVGKLCDRLEDILQYVFVEPGEIHDLCDEISYLLTLIRATSAVNLSSS